jgi:hypothetical protein
LAKSKTSLQNNQSKKAGGMAQEVECLSSKCKALSLKPIQLLKKRERKYSREED